MRTALALLLLLLAPCSALAESLILSLSSEKIAITSSFNGAELALFGSIERDAATVARASAYDVVVTLRGPRGAVAVREKKASGPFWFNRETRKYIAIPAFISVLTSRPLDEIAGEDLRRKLFLGIDNLVPAQSDRSKESDPDEPDFRAALIRIRRAQRLFIDLPNAVHFLSPTLFRASLRVPGKVPLGRYAADVMIFADSALLTHSTVSFTVTKGGIEQDIATAAFRNPFLYGGAAVFMALMFGWFASLVFRRD